MTYSHHLVEYWSLRAYAQREHYHTHIGEYYRRRWYAESFDCGMPWTTRPELVDRKITMVLRFGP